MTFSTVLLKGKPVAEKIREALVHEVESLSERKVIPGLAVILVGNDPASQVYVRNKARTFRKLNCKSETINLPADTEEEKIIALLHDLNNDPQFHGILVQLPLPKHMNSERILKTIRPEKDVDGFHPVNLGYLLEGHPRFIPCTPGGILEMLKYYEISTAGKHAVIVGRSNIVGKPMFALLAQKSDTGNATVTLCHSRTPDIGAFTRQADLLIVASGVPRLVTGDMIKPGVDIIDVGINRVNDDSEKGYHLEGDVDINSVMGIARSITPVPGGVGPMTITMLVHNTVLAAQRSMRP